MQDGHSYTALNTFIVQAAYAVMLLNVGSSSIRRQLRAAALKMCQEHFSASENIKLSKHEAFKELQATKDRMRSKTIGTGAPLESFQARPISTLCY